MPPPLGRRRTEPFMTFGPSAGPISVTAAVYTHTPHTLGMLILSLCAFRQLSFPSLSFPPISLLLKEHILYNPSFPLHYTCSDNIFHYTCFASTLHYACSASTPHYTCSASVHSTGKDTFQPWGQTSWANGVDDCEVVLASRVLALSLGMKRIQIFYRIRVLTG